jgi:hypothetical protein
MIYEFSPKQSYNGYDKPWAPGDGVNVWDEEWEKGTLNYANGEITYSDTNIRSKNFIPVTPSTSYFPKKPSDNNIVVCGYDEDFHFTNNPRYSAANTAFTVNADTKYIKFCTIGTPLYGGTYKDDISINYPSTEISYYPYANICPPEGFNIWDPSNQEFVQVYAGYVNTNTRELYLRPWYTEYDGEELVGPWMSSMELYEEDTTPTSGAFVVDLGGELLDMQITPFMLQTLLDSLGIRQHFMDGASMLNSLMDQAQGRKRDQRSVPQLKVKPIGEELPPGLKFKAIENMNVLPGLSGKYII